MSYLIPRSHVLPFTLMCAIVWAGPVAGGDGDEYQRRFEREAPAAWARYQEATRYAQGTWRGEAVIPERTTKWETELKVNQTGRVLRTNGIGGTFEVFGQNAQYSFRLRERQKTGWVLVEVHQSDQSGGDRAEGIERRLNQFSVDPDPLKLQPDGQSLPDILRSPQTRITSVRTLATRVGLIEITFDAVPNPADGRKLLGGTLILDPSREWLPVVTTARVRTNVATGTHTTEYDFRDSHPPLVRRIVDRQEYALFNPAGVWQASGSTECDVSVPAQLPGDHEFTLAAFGLPEPMQESVPPSRNYRWFFAAAGGFLLLAIVFRQLARRRAVANPT